MKKFLKITGITLAVFLALLIILPFVFKGKIVEQVKIAINENVNAKVEFGTFRLSFIRNFPNVSFRLNDLSVVGINEFEGDTLAGVGSFFVSVNIRSLLGSSGFEIKTIRVDDPRIFLKVLEDGGVNWDIVKESDVETTPVDTTEDDFKLALKRLTVNNGFIVYDDREMEFYTRMENFNHTLRGDFTADFSTLKIRNTSTERLFVRFEGMPLLHGVYAELTADIDADLNAFLFTFRDNSLRLNDLTAKFEGSFAMPESDMIMDITFASPQQSFKSFLSLVPALYAKDFEDLTTSGTMGFNGYVKGILSDEHIPGFDINLEVENGMFQYPDLPAAVTDVYIKTRIVNTGNDPDHTEIDVSRFALNVGGNPVEFRMNLKTPVSDPQIDAALKGKIDLARVKDFYPLDPGESLAGLIESDIVAIGRLSSIENERYDDFIFTGNMSINGLDYKNEDFPEGITISTMRMDFSPRFAQLQTFTMKMGESDISANGRIDNILGFALKDQTLSGRFETTSSFFNLNQFMDDEPAPETEEPFELSVIEVPANLDFSLQSRFDKILFDNLEITNATGVIRVADQTVTMSNLRMSMLGGTLIINGSYSTKDVTMPSIDFGLNITNFDIQQTFNTFNTFAMIAPIGERATGRFSAGFDLRSLLDQNLDPVVSTLAGGGTFSSSAITVENSPALLGLADNLKMDMFKSLDVRDILINFEFKDGRVDVKPFETNFGRSKATVSGNHGFDQTINYLLSIGIPRAEFGGAANQALDGLVSQAAGRGINITPSETVNVGVGITGTVSEPRINLTLAQTGEDARQQMMDAIQDAVKDIVGDVREQADDVIDDAREQVSEELERRANQVIAEAERQAETIRREASSNAERIRSEAREQAQNLENEASGPIAKAAAKRAGDQLIKTADEQAARLEREADERSTSMVNEAKQRADRIRTGEE